MTGPVAALALTAALRRGHLLLSVVRIRFL